jgi:hypothetical protein
MSRIKVGLPSGEVARGAASGLAAALQRRPPPALVMRGLPPPEGMPALQQRKEDI